MFSFNAITLGSEIWGRGKVDIGDWAGQEAPSTPIQGRNMTIPNATPSSALKHIFSPEQAVFLAC